jgi:sortase (surface protein transpeptidase)
VNFENPGIIRSHFVNDIDRSSLFCRLLIEPNAGKIGNQSILDLGVIAAVDVYSATGATSFVDDVDICLQGSGYLLFLNANDSPRVPQIVTAWSTPAFPGYVCATLHAPGMLVLVRRKPQLVTSAPASGGAAPQHDLWTHQPPVPALDTGLELQIPALNLKAPITPVGLTWNNQMAAPVGRPSDKVWQSAFWYQYSAVPGTVGTATIAGHYDDTLGRPAIFAYLSELKHGDLIIVHDPLTSTDSTFVVTEVNTYSDAEVRQPAILSQIFGASFSVQPPLPLDNISRLTLITCDGTWINGAFNNRVVVYAVRVATPPHWLN